MGKYTDDEIRAMSKITIKIAADYLGISTNLLTLGMRNNVLPIGFAVKNEDAYRESWSYSIIPERLIAYNHGKINEIQVEGIEKNLSRIISQFEDLKRDLVFLLSESFNRFLIISLDVLICRYSPLLRAFPALFISEEPHKSFYYPLCFRSQK